LAILSDKPRLPEVERTSPAVRVLLLIALGLCSIAAFAYFVPPVLSHRVYVEQLPDHGFNPEVRTPAFVDHHPQVCFDEGHNNFHRLNTTYSAFASLLRSDGFSVSPLSGRFTADTLRNCQILVIAAPRRTWPAGPYSPEEQDAVIEWVRSGGSLFMAADINTFAVALRPLASRFGIELRTGIAFDPTQHEPTLDPSVLVFSEGQLAHNPITTGRGPDEHIHRVITFSGTSIASHRSAAVLNIAPTARYAQWVKAVGDGVPPATYAGFAPIKGESQAAAFQFGSGRVFVSADAGMFSAQTVVRTNSFGREVERIKWGMNRDGCDNKQFTLNVMHWLSGVLG
jgi:hypothetical protein